MSFFSVFPRLLPSPLLLRISEDLEVTFDVASRVFLTMSVGVFVGLLFSGFVARKFSHRWTIVGSVALCGVMMMLLSLARSVALVHLAMLVMGWANGNYFGSGVTSVASLSPDVHRGKSMAIHEVGPNLAYVVAPILSSLLAPRLGWQGVFFVSGIATLAGAVLFAKFGRANSDNGEPPHFRNIALIAGNRSFWIITFLFSISAIAGTGIFSVLPTYLVTDHGLPERLVNVVVGMSRVVAVVAILFSGVLADRFGFKIVVFVLLLVTGTATFFIGAASGRFVLLWVFLQPASIGAFFPVGMTALTNATSPRIRNLAVAFSIPIVIIVGAGIAPPIMTAAGAAGGFRIAFMVLGIFIAASVVVLPLMKTGSAPREEKV